MTPTQEPATGPAEIDVDAATLLGDDLELLDDALADAAPVAVTAPPYAGRSTVLDRAAARLDAATIALGPTDGAAAIRDAVGDGPAVVDGCHHLYERRVDGFDGLEALVDALAAADDTVVTGWNGYAWRYLDAVRGLGDDHGAVVGTRRLDGEAIARVVRGAVDDLPRFTAPESAVDLIDVRRREVAVRGRTVSLPVPVVDATALAARGAADADPASLAFERLAAASDGNPGVAVAVARAWRDRETLAADEVDAPRIEGKLDDDEAFFLRLVLAGDRATRDALDRVLDADVDRLVARFERTGVVASDGTSVAIRPAAVPGVHAALDRRWLT